MIIAPRVKYYGFFIAVFIVLNIFVFSLFSKTLKVVVAEQASGTDEFLQY